MDAEKPTQENVYTKESTLSNAPKSLALSSAEMIEYFILYTFSSVMCSHCYTNASRYNGTDTSLCMSYYDKALENVDRGMIMIITENKRTWTNKSFVTNHLLQVLSQQMDTNKQQLQAGTSCNHTTDFWLPLLPNGFQMASKWLQKQWHDCHSKPFVLTATNCGIVATQNVVAAHHIYKCDVDIFCRQMWKLSLSLSLSFTSINHRYYTHNNCEYPTISYIYIYNIPSTKLFYPQI